MFGCWQYGAESWASLLFLGCVVAALLGPAAWCQHKVTRGVLGPMPTFTPCLPEARAFAQAINWVSWVVGACFYIAVYIAGNLDQDICAGILSNLLIQDAKEGRDREHIEALRSTYLTHGKSRREAQPIKKRVRILLDLW